MNVQAMGRSSQDVMMTYTDDDDPHDGSDHENEHQDGGDHNIAGAVRTPAG